MAAHDRVSHTYMLKILMKFVFGDRLIRSISEIYANTTGLIKHRGRLSGSLDVLCFEVLLHNLRRSLTDNAIDLAFSETKIAALAYADDLLVMVIHDNSSEMEEWKNRTDQPLGVKWGNRHFKYLGINMGENWHTLNDAALSQKLNKSDSTKLSCTELDLVYP